MERPYVFLADLLRGLVDLKIRDPEIARDVLRMLSLDRLEAGPATTLGGAFDSRVLKPPAPSSTDSGRGRLEQPLPPQLTELRRATLRQVTPPLTTTRAPVWAASVTAAPRPAGATVTRARVAPLFPRVQSRGLLTAAISTWSADGPLDVSRVVDTLARAEPLRELPFELTASVRLGVQLLIDTGRGMWPYLADVDHVCLTIEGIVARDQLQLHYFSGCPSRGCATRGADSLKPWQPPARGTPVLLLTDLGIGVAPNSDDRADASEWLAFADLVRTAGCTPIALVTYGPRRWPRALARVIHIVHWDRRTNAALVRRLLAGLRAPR